jgi:hypothetical protein
MYNTYLIYMCMKYIQLFENYNQAKSILRKQNLDDTDPNYITIDGFVNSKGYMGLFTKLHYIDGVDLETLHVLATRLDRNKAILKGLKDISGIQVQDYIKDDPKRPTMDSIERLSDDLTTLESIHAEKKILKELPKEWKRKLELATDDQKTKFTALAKQVGKSSEYKPLFKKLAKLNTIEDLLKELSELLDKIEGGLDYDSIMDKLENPENYFDQKLGEYDDEYEVGISAYVAYNKNGIIVAHIRNFNSSKAYGSKAWCISQEQHYWDDYITDDYGIDTELYFIWDFNLPTHDKLHQIGTVRKVKGFGSTHDKEDNSINIEELSYFKDIEETMDYTEMTGPNYRMEGFLEEFGAIDDISNYYTNNDNTMFLEYCDDSDLEMLFESLDKIIEDNLRIDNSKELYDFIDALSLEELLKRDLDIFELLIDHYQKYEKTFKEDDYLSELENYDLEYSLRNVKGYDRFEYMLSKIDKLENHSKFLKNAIELNDIKTLELLVSNGYDELLGAYERPIVSKEMYLYVKKLGFLPKWQVSYPYMIIDSIAKIDDMEISKEIINNMNDYILTSFMEEIMFQQRLLNFETFLVLEEYYLANSESDNPKANVVKKFLNGDVKSMVDYDKKFQYLKEFINPGSFRVMRDMTIKYFLETRLPLGDITIIDILNVISTNGYNNVENVCNDLAVDFEDIEFESSIYLPDNTIFMFINFCMENNIQKEFIKKVMKSVIDNLDTYEHTNIGYGQLKLISEVYPESRDKLLDKDLLESVPDSIPRGLYKLFHNELDNDFNNYLFKKVITSFKGDNVELFSNLKLNKENRDFILKAFKKMDTSSNWWFNRNNYSTLFEKGNMFDMTLPENIEVFHTDELKAFIMDDEDPDVEEIED